ncbi:MAG: hypothetical protein P4L56_08465 [Candidatus Sulfopaludibacter sp.]|nr:hypothetical protein [Candidatus Sulfopaludibacter sp.]
MTFQDANPRDGAVGCSTLIYLATAAYLAIGVLTYLAWRISGNPAWIDGFFGLPGGLLTVALALVQLTYSVRLCSQFLSGEPLNRAWQLISASAGCDLVSSLNVQIFSVDSFWNPVTHLAGWSKSSGATIRQVGLIAGGPLRFALLALGLLYTLRIYRRSGFLGRLTRADWTLLSVVAIYVINEFRDLWIALQHGKHPALGEILNWPVDPLLWVLLAEAMLLYRSTRRMGPGWIGRCWVAFSAGIALVVLGDISIWAMSYGYLPYPWSSIGWYLWLPSSAAFAVAPVYQMDVIRKASSRRFTR